MNVLEVWVGMTDIRILLFTLIGLVVGYVALVDQQQHHDWARGNGWFVGVCDL